MGRGSLVKRGSVVVVELPPTPTHEQTGCRPCVVVSSEDSVVKARYEMLVIVPLSSTRLNGRLYPIIKKGDGSLKNHSVALVDQLRSIDKQRVSKVGAPISSHAMWEIDSAIKYLLGFDID